MNKGWMYVSNSLYIPIECKDATPQLIKSIKSCKFQKKYTIIPPSKKEKKRERKKKKYIFPKAIPFKF